MANKEKQRAAQQERKRLSVRASIHGTSQRPRLSVFRSHKNIYCQIIDDDSSKTLASASSRDKSLRDGLKGLKKRDIAEKIGVAIADLAKKAGVAAVCFDRGHYKYHGRVKALADGARKAGLKF